MTNKHAGTTQEQIEYVLRRRIGKGDLDWDTLLDRDAMQMAYDMAGGSRGLAEGLDIAIEAAKTILKIHGIRLRKQGGAHKKNAAQMGLTKREDLHEIGKSYKLTTTELALLRAHARDTVRVCPGICPLALFCWDGLDAHNRRKKPKCGLGDHLIAVGLNGEGCHG